MQHMRVIPSGKAMSDSKRASLTVCLFSLLLVFSVAPAKAGTLHTWIGGTSGLWTNETSWSDGIAPLTTNDDAQVDANPLQATTVVYTMTNGTAATIGALTIDAGDAVTLNKQTLASAGSASLVITGALRNAGTLTTGGTSGSSGAHGNGFTVTVQGGAGGTFNASGGVMYVKSLAGYRRSLTYFSLPADNSNAGEVHVQNTTDQSGGKIRVALTGNGSPTFTNIGSITLEGRGTMGGGPPPSGNNTWVVMGPGTSNATLTVAGSGILQLSSSLSSDTSSYAMLTGVQTGTSLVNAPTHTIQGNGYIGVSLSNGGSGNTLTVYTFASIVNQGLIRAARTANLAELRIAASGGSLLNAAGGRMVAGGDAGTVLRIGSDTASVTFTNQGLLETRTGTAVSFASNTVTVLHGELRGGGAFVVITNSLSLAADATLAPGDSATTNGTGASLVGMLSVTGNLVLASSTVLNYQLGAPGVAGVDYDTVAVSSNLTLDGTLNIEALPGYLPHRTYRLFTFRAGGGGVTDNGLTVPQGYKVVVDDINGTVDLVSPAVTTAVFFK